MVRARFLPMRPHHGGFCPRSEKTRLHKGPFCPRPSSRWHSSYAAAPFSASWPLAFRLRSMIGFCPRSEKTRLHKGPFCPRPSSRWHSSYAAAPFSASWPLAFRLRSMMRARYTAGVSRIDVTI